MTTRAPLLAAALGLLLAAPASRAQTLRTMSSSRQLHGERALTVDVSYVAGRFRLLPAEPGTMYQMEMRYDEEKFTPVREFDPSDNSLRLGLRSHGHVTLADRGDPDDAPTLDLTLATGVPLALTVELGAAEANADFGGLAITRLSYKTGASRSQLRFTRPNPVACDEVAFDVGAAQFTATGLGNLGCARMKFEGGVGSVTLDFTGAWRASERADVSVALGTVRLRLPQGLGVSITLDRFLASFDQEGFTQRGSVWYSDGYAAAGNHLDLKVESAFGGIQVEWVGAGR